MRKDLFRVAFVLMLTAVTLAVLAARVSRGQGNLHEGDIWLQWSQGAREAYVYGFSAGYGGGYESACRLMDKLWPGPKGVDADNDPLKKCVTKETSLSRSADYYADAVTGFYKRYPGDHDIDIDEVLELVAKGLTIDEIHRYPFWRRSPSTSRQ